MGNITQTRFVSGLRNIVVSSMKNQFQPAGIHFLMDISFMIVCVCVCFFVRFFCICFFFAFHIPNCNYVIVPMIMNLSWYVYFLMLRKCDEHESHSIELLTRVSSCCCFCHYVNYFIAFGGARSFFHVQFVLVILSMFQWFQLKIRFHRVFYFFAKKIPELIDKECSDIYRVTFHIIVFVSSLL